MVDEAHVVAIDLGAVCLERIENHKWPNGYYSEQAMAKALEIHGRYEFCQIPLHLQDGGVRNLLSPDVFGAVVHSPGHWRATRVFKASVWLLNSLADAPEQIGHVASAETWEAIASLGNVFLIRRALRDADIPDADADDGQRRPNVVWHADHGTIGVRPTGGDVEEKGSVGLAAGQRRDDLGSTGGSVGTRDTLGVQVSTEPRPRYLRLPAGPSAKQSS